MSSPGFKRFVNALAFVSTVCIGVALILTLIFSKVDALSGAAEYIRMIGEIFAYLIVCIMAFSYVRTKRHIAWILVYVVCVTVIFTMLILVTVL